MTHYEAKNDFAYVLEGRQDHLPFSTTEKGSFDPLYYGLIAVVETRNETVSYPAHSYPAQHK
eukprot:scaffold233081_cov28-Attheya_sp.AAC.1